MAATDLTDLQLDIMRVLWRAGEATVVDVHRAIEQERGLALPTVATLLSRLEKKGAVAHRTEGRQFVYRAVISESSVRRSFVSQIRDSLFGGDLPALVHQLLDTRNVRPQDLEDVKLLIAQKEQELKAAAKKPAKKRRR
ncbi:MAG TPA: BlaI/MecI/CopY family transcriptional regulator [Gemmatimonadaceae bacterium]|nr:BlaI/MecI/CopY family transcriptional regulator [Gemmatimonadaceae bacterium]